MTRNLICVIGALLVTMTTGRSVEAVPLSNTPTSAAAICSDFDCTAEVTLSDTYEFTPEGVDGTLFSFVAPGVGAFAGKWVYLYQLAQDTDSSENLGGITVDFLDLVPPGASIVCTDCGAVTGTGDDGSQAPSNADYTDGVTSWFFLVPSKVPPGVTTNFFGAISERAPRISEAVVLNSVQVDQPAALIPVPEPGTLMLCGVGAASLVAKARRRRKQNAILHS